MVRNPERARDETKMAGRSVGRRAIAVFLLFMLFLILGTGCKKKGGSAPVSSGGVGIGGGPPVYSGVGAGTHYWIDAVAGNDANPGTSALPFKTIDKIELLSLQPGDLVHVKAGTYTIVNALLLTSIHGSAAKWIGIQAEGAVVLRHADTNKNLIEVRDCYYLFLKGFEIYHQHGGTTYNTWPQVDGIKFMQQNSHDVTIENCHIHDCGDIGISVRAPEVYNLVVYNCEVNNCYCGFYWGYYETPVANRWFANNSRIANCYIHHCPPQDIDGTGYGIQIKGGSHGNVIEDNVLVTTGASAQAGIAVYHISTDGGTSADRNVIRRNFLYATRGEGIYAAEGAVIENNILVNTDAVGISIAQRNTGGYGIFHGNILCRHNTIFQVAQSAGRGLLFGMTSFNAPYEFDNNVVAVTGGGLQLAIKGPNTFPAHGYTAKNFAYGTVEGGGLGNVTLPNLACFMSTTYGNANFLYPASGGPLIGAGVGGAKSTAVDYNLESRVGSTPDGGAYEAVSAANSGPTLGAGFK